MRVLFVGLGSIGKRHLKNLKFIEKQQNRKFFIDALRSSSTSKAIEGIDKEYFQIKDLPDNYDIIFICNPTAMHHQSIIALKNKAKYFFVEKPLFHKSVNNLSFLDNKENNFYIACPLRYCAALRYVYENIDLNDVISCRSICSTYLPEWRPNVDYRNVYSAKKDLGGGVIIDLIHEMDYLVNFFGIPNQCKGFYGKFSNLEIQSEDYAAYLLKYEKHVVELHLDYFGRVRRRELELYTNDDIVVADIDKNLVYLKKDNIQIDLKEDLNERYIFELLHFLDIVDGKIENDHNAKLANQILKLAQSIEEEDYE